MSFHRLLSFVVILELLRDSPVMVVNLDESSKGIIFVCVHRAIRHNSFSHANQRLKLIDRDKSPVIPKNQKTLSFINCKDLRILFCR